VSTGKGCLQGNMPISEKVNWGHALSVQKIAEADMECLIMQKIYSPQPLGP
jgi:hypothetical protein